MSQHIVQNDQYRFVFGWDQPLLSFYLHKHDARSVVNPVVWLGGTIDTQMYEVDHLVQVASEHGLRIGHEMQVELYGERDDGR